VDLQARRITVVIPDEIIVEPSKQDADPAEVSS
jgi:hypothetical protein